MEFVKENHLHIKLWRLIFALVVVNAVSILLKYFNLNTYIILIGFRCHISFILPFFLIFNPDFLPYIKKSFLNPEYKKPFVFLILILLPFLVLSGFLFFSHNIDLGDPEYFYEFGVSSVADYPVYLLWNFPQAAMFFFFLTAVSTVLKFRFITVFSVIVLLFAIEITPINHSPFSFSDLEILLSCSILFSVLIIYFRNIYWFCIVLFTMFWFPLLAFGSNSKTLVNLLFASQYKYWEGFLEVSKYFAPYALPAYFAAALLLSIIVFIFRKKTENQN